MHKNCIDMMNFLLYNRYVTNSKGAFLCMRYPQIVKKMSLEQKAAFVSGYDYWHLEEAPELGLPKINKNTKINITLIITYHPPYISYQPEN